MQRPGQNWCLKVKPGFMTKRAQKQQTRLCHPVVVEQNCEADADGALPRKPSTDNLIAERCEDADPSVQVNVRRTIGTSCFLSSSEYSLECTLSWPSVGIVTLLSSGMAKTIGAVHSHCLLPSCSPASL